MAKVFRRLFLLLLLVLGGLLFLIPAEQIPTVGQWLTRAGLEPQTVRLLRGEAFGPQAAAVAPSPSPGHMDIRYVRKGQGETVVLIHGLASSIFTWADMIDPLSREFDVIALDLPGFGGSSQPGDLSFDDTVVAVLGLMDALGVSKGHLVGNSMGGAISLVIAARHPERVDHLVIVDSAGLDLKERALPLTVQLLASGTAGAIADHVPVRRSLTLATLRQLVHDPSRVTDERVREYVAPLLRPGALTSIRSLLLSRRDQGVEEDLAAIRAPTLVVWGRFDPWLPESHGDRFARAIKGARKVVLETGHMPQEEKPADMARLLGEFFTS